MMNSTTETGTPRFRAVLRPNRSLSPTGFLVLMGLVVIVNLVTGIVFLLLGAWPILLFCGFDVALVYLAFRWSYRDGRLTETIEIDPRSISITRLHPSGKREDFALNAYWTRVCLDEHVSGTNELVFTSHGRSLPFARFLSNDERRELASVLSAELYAARTSLPQS